MNIIEKRRLRDLRDTFYNAPVHIKQTRWYKITKVRLDRVGDPGPDPSIKEPYVAPEGCPFPELADGGDYCKDCQTPVEGCVTLASATCPGCGKNTLVNVGKEGGPPEFHCYECNYHGDGSPDEQAPEDEPQ